MTYYYNSFENGKRRIIKYDENISGNIRRCGKRIFLYHNVISITEILNSVDEAIKAWGVYKTYEIILPDGTITTPARYFNKNINDVFISYSMVRGGAMAGGVLILIKTIDNCTLF